MDFSQKDNIDQLELLREKINKYQDDTTERNDGAEKKVFLKSQLSPTRQIELLTLKSCLGNYPQKMSWNLDLIYEDYEYDYDTTICWKDSIHLDISVLRGERNVSEEK